MHGISTVHLQGISVLIQITLKSLEGLDNPKPPRALGQALTKTCTSCSDHRSLHRCAAIAASRFTHRLIYLVVFNHVIIRYCFLPSPPETLLLLREHEQKSDACVCSCVPVV